MTSQSPNSFELPSSYHQLCANWRVRLKERLVHRRAFAYWPLSTAVDAMDRPQLLALQQQRLADLLQYAMRHVPFYQRWAQQHGFDPANPPALAQWPIIDKDTYHREPDAFQSALVPMTQMKFAKTSGSSAEPFRFRIHRKAVDHSYCCLWRALARHGLRPGDRRVYVWGRSYVFNTNSRQARHIATRHRFRNWLNNTLSVNAYNLTHENVAAAVEQITEFAPRYLHGYVSALFVIARWMLDHNQRFSFPLVAAVTEAEKLYDFQRQAMEQAFGCRVIEHYGSMELGNMAEQDPEGLMRLNEDAYVFETGNGGEAIITSLFSHAYPFIRYKLGDLLEISGQAGGRLPYAVLASVKGRVVDLLPVPAGGYVHGVALAHIIDPHLKYVRKYQVHQLAVDRFQIRLATSAPLSRELTEQIISDLRRLVGADVTVEVLQVDDIPPASNGKFRWVLSDVSDVARRMLREDQQAP